MKILSKFKDYYDYLQGIYGIDETILYNRTFKEPFYHLPYLSISGYKYKQPEPYILAICSTIYIVHLYNGSFYFGDDIFRILQLTDNKYKHNRHYKFNGDYFAVSITEKHKLYTDVNIKHNCPVCLIVPATMQTKEIIIKNIRLADFGLAQILAPQYIYSLISGFLTQEKFIEHPRTDVEKIISHGFDKKTSFRNVK